MKAVFLPDALPCVVLSLSLAEPQAPSGVSLSSLGSPHSLLASWEEATGEGYLLVLSLAEQPVRNSSLLRGVTNFTYNDLHPGTLYTFEVSTVAGPYTSSPRRISNWTCECHSLGFPLDPALLLMSYLRALTAHIFYSSIQ